MKDEVSAAQRKTQFHLLTLKEAAEKLGIRPITLYTWCQMKKIPYFKIGRYLKFDERDIDSFISGQRIESVSY